LRQCSALTLPDSQTGRSCGIYLPGFNIDEDNGSADGVCACRGSGREALIFRPAIARCAADVEHLLPDRSISVTDCRRRFRSRNERVLDATLRRIRAEDFYTNTSYEYWGRARRYTYVADGRSDMKIPIAREFTFGRMQHFSGAFRREIQSTNVNIRHSSCRIKSIGGSGERSSLIWMNGARWQDAPDSIYPKVSENAV